MLTLSFVDKLVLMSKLTPSNHRSLIGLAIFTQVKAGFVWSGRMGSGIVIARLADGSWSAPSCIGTGGVGFGLQIGAVS